jgi:threonine synthase
MRPQSKEFVIYRPPTSSGRLELSYSSNKKEEWRPSIKYSYKLDDIKSQLTPAENYRYQLTTYGKNIHAIEVMDDFDACQRMVKMAFADEEIRSSIFLTSANSINVARWLPQQLYYFMALQQWQEKEPPVISVPSGNFGNICAGMMAAAGGLQIEHFIAAVNANDVVYNYLQTGNYKVTKAVPTLSNAMDVGDPSNFVRIMQIFGNSFPALKNNLKSYRITDEETIETISSVYHKNSYTLDPHGAVAYLALERHLEKHQKAIGFFLETAHPVKFPAAVEITLYPAFSLVV